MTYNKPEVAVLGNAAALIEIVNGAKPNTGADGVPLGSGAAYDLDEKSTQESQFIVSECGRLSRSPGRCSGREILRSLMIPRSGKQLFVIADRERPSAICASVHTGHV